MQKILLVGTPNSGKSLLFNQLTGLRQKVANFPSVTVELKSGILTALIVSGVLNKMTEGSKELQDMPFILELPSYRLPHWQPMFYRIINSGVQFIKRAAPIIFVVSLIIWTLGYFPNNGDLQNSYLSTIGQWIEPIFTPLGVDWRYGVAILVSMSFYAVLS